MKYCPPLEGAKGEDKQRLRIKQRAKPLCKKKTPLLYSLPRETVGVTKK